MDDVMCLIYAVIWVRLISFVSMFIIFIYFECGIVGSMRGWKGEIHY